MYDPQSLDVVRNAGWHHGTARARKRHCRILRQLEAALTLIPGTLLGVAGEPPGDGAE